MRNASAKLESVIASRWTCNPSTGDFFRDGILYSVKPTVIKCRPYIHLNIAGTKVRAHRLMWRLVYGEWPKNDIDHINGDSLDNRIDNLRDVTTAANNKNKSRFRARELPTGIYAVRKSFYAEVTCRGKTKRGACRKSIQEAIADRLRLLRVMGFTDLHIRATRFDLETE